jgi:hypothetical protein
MSGDDWLLGVAANSDPAKMTDDQRESLILQLSDKRDKLFLANKRDQARLVQERIAALIAQRSGAYVRHMEQEKGLFSPFCARKPSGPRGGGGHA